MLAVTLSDRFAELVMHYGEATAKYYYLPDGTDWDVLSEFIVERPALEVLLAGVEEPFRQNLIAFPSRVSLAEENGTQVLYEADPQDTPSGIYGASVCQATFSFNLPLNGDCEVEIAPLDGGSSRTVIVDSQSLTLPLPREAARYTVHGEFQGKDEKLYQLEFQFEIGSSEQQN